MIAYFDTSALVPLIVAEPTSVRCRRVWDQAEAVLTVELTYVEAAAALARAQRLGRLTGTQHAEALQRWDALWDQVVSLSVDTQLVRSAAGLAATYGLRGYDAVHCAAAVGHADSTVVATAGDGDLLEAWRTAGLAVVDTTG
ncbi:Predicted nucleic acid-binding protein, contains PIN domain [Geodermatophilus saharensis]|uniref:Ribonuclease VapC n=1 Tax=Geodermatophilus saharensis TaxID=1137994 RepID=A0A239EHA3_9ACTN|nr:type II toxin-antitoxin system VapC family toxin [Geodermatophilus saharensis]SNS43949.1 Predicted nucleic acid-binding protein, contains PIN domain [Geodermatophilus saharensis]